ncbi:MAG: hypothetical protein IPJ65_20125 [Archangiaceae bacterium]|nr:hypothetical protein [Archangiaceae bacterium]
MLAATALLLVELLAASRGPRRAPKVPEGALLAPVKAPEAGPGQVTYVTEGDTFVDRGSADGLTVGTQLQATRAGRPVGVCVVAQVTEHGATCQGPPLEIGDRISAQRKAKPAAQPLPALPDARELAARRDALGDTEAPLVDFTAGPGAASGAATWLSVVLSHATWADLASGSTYQLERVDARVTDVRIWRGLRASADLSVLWWNQRPARFASPYAAPAQVFVRQLELAWRDGGRFEAAVGRIFVRHAPGMSIIDGAQAGVKSASGNLQGGLFAGLLPRQLTLEPTLTQWTAGAYASARFSRGEGAQAFWVQPELRLDWALRDGLGGRFELGVAVNAWAGRSFDIHLQAQLAVLGTTAPGLLDFARLDLSLRPTDRLRLWLGVRYRGLAAGDVLEVGAPAPGARGLHADLSAFFDGSAFSVGVAGNFAHDFDSRLWQARVGPQLIVPRAFGRLGGLALGYAEEVGWLPGRSAYLSLSFQPHWRFRGLLRGSWFMQSPVGWALGVSGHELGAALALEVRFTPWLWLRGNLALRQALQPLPDFQTELGGTAPRTGVSGGAQLGLEL